jgi:hypothetical protein
MGFDQLVPGVDTRNSSPVGRPAPCLGKGRTNRGRVQLHTNMSRRFRRALAVAVTRTHPAEQPGLRDEFADLLAAGGDSFRRLCELATSPASTPARRQNACWFLGLLRNPKAGATLLRALDDSDPRVRSEAARVLGYLGIRRALGPLLARLHDPSPWVRGSAAEGLGCLGDQRAADALAHIQADANEDPEVQRSAAIALWRLRDRRGALDWYPGNPS